MNIVYLVLGNHFINLHMSDERYKKGFQEYLRPFGFDPDQYNEGLLKRVRQEEKRLNMITLVPVGVGIFLAALRYLIVEVTFAPHIWETSINFFAVFLICYLYFIFSARMHFSKVKKCAPVFCKPGESILSPGWINIRCLWPVYGLLPIP